VPDASAAPEKNKYLVATSFSRKSEQALDFALIHSLLDPAEIYLFYVHEDTSSDFRRLDKLNEELMERMRVQMMQSMQRLGARGLRPTVEDVHRRLSHGKAAKEILSMADGIQPDYIVMGAPDSNAFRKLLTHAPCTLILVKDKDYT